MKLTHDGYLKLAGHFIPKSDNTYDIGSSSLRWKNTYLSGTLYGKMYYTRDSGDNSTKFLTIAATSPNNHFHLFADYVKQSDATDVTVFFGYNAEILKYEFRSKWSGANETLLKLDGSALVNYSRTFLPMSDNSYDLGSSSYRWKNGYFVNEVYVDGVPVTKAENGGQHIWVQSTAPTAKAVGDIWIQI